MPIHTPISDDFFVYHRNFSKELGLIGVATILAGVLYFVASNWFWLPHALRIAMITGLFALTALASTIPAVARHLLTIQTLQTASGILVGLSLAVIGQAYQTGADSFILFALWSALLLPWLYQHNTGIYFVWCVVSQSALWLFFVQHFGNANNLIYLCIAHMLAGVQFFIMSHWYPATRFLLVAILSILSIFCAILTHDYALDFLTKLTSFVLMIAAPTIASNYLRRQNHQGAMALMLTGLGISVSTFLFIHWDWNSLFDLLALGVITLGWFFALGKLLIHIFPKSVFYHIPATVGAWLSGLIFALTVLTFWGSFSMVLGAISFIFALILFAKYPHRHFIRQLAYCLMLAGQLAFLVHFGDKTDSLLAVLLVQGVMTVIALVFRLPWLMITYQTLCLYACICLYIANTFDVNYPIYLNYIHSVFLLTFIFLTAQHKFIQQYTHAIVSLTPLLIAATLIQKSITSDSLSLTNFKPQLNLANSVWLMLFLVSFYCYQNKNLRQIAVLGGLGLTLSSMGYFELFILLLGLLWANTHNNKIAQGLYLTSIGLFLWQIYYSLEMSFLLKSGTMLVSGVVFLIIARHLYQAGERFAQIPFYNNQG